MKNFLIIGSGGREHALGWKLKKDDPTCRIYFAPGNGGTQKIGINLEINANEYLRLVEAAKDHRIDLTIVGPEGPLVDGLVNIFHHHGLHIFGPGKSAAQLEGSKAYTKELAKKIRIPTADFRVFSDPFSAKQYLRQKDMPIVIKANGLAGGKGVYIAQTIHEAERIIDELMRSGKFGKSGERIVIEDFLPGHELSLMYLIAWGTDFFPLPPARDYKKLLDGDKGPNTGGMGGYSPVPGIETKMVNRVRNEIILPTVLEMRERDCGFRGILYAGLMIDEDQESSLMEFNVRFGDPECQLIMARMKSSLIDILKWTISKELYPRPELEFEESFAVCVVMASAGYPDNPIIGKPIFGLHEAEKTGALIFHCGTEEEDGQYFTTGGRVLTVTASGSTIEKARAKVYEAVAKIYFEGMQFRTDIAQI